MSECVILFRNPHNNAVGFISAQDGESIEVFPHLDAAIELSRKHMVLTAWPHQIVELDEL